MSEKAFCDLPANFWDYLPHEALVTRTSSRIVVDIGSVIRLRCNRMTRGSIVQSGRFLHCPINLEAPN